MIRAVAQILPKFIFNNIKGQFLKDEVLIYYTKLSTGPLGNKILR